ncbi:S41 family peptidase [uncultured Dokdonia sp.]|uniref:S41 family peptidase n=1 Tax=uncultured Dokdonia sp. TaxID=575653 RepID=UPI002613260C|nr:S41 family peptidase [uncultured Dokdonia sp.]
MKTILITISLLCVSIQSYAQFDPLQERREMVNTIIDLADTHMCNPTFLETEEWDIFVKYIQSEEVLSLEETEFKNAFNRATQKLTFSHFYLTYSTKEKRRQAKKRKKTTVTKKAFELSEIDSETVVLTIREFISNVPLMKSLVTEILEKDYKNLIIDVRGNRGGTLDAAVVLGQFITPKMIDAGSYLSRSWFEQNDHYPTSEEITSFPFLQDMTYAGFREAAKKPAFRMVVPPHNNPTFKGKVYVLTDKYTASTCEPFVYLIKEQGVAEIVGEHTAGAMLSGMNFKLTKNLHLFMPVQDYITADGSRLDKVGVAPTIKTAPEDALNTVLELL